MFTWQHILLYSYLVSFQVLLPNRNETTPTAEVDSGNDLGLNYIVVVGKYKQPKRAVDKAPGQNLV